MKNNNTAKILRTIARTLLLIVACFWFIFALLSDAEEYGGGISGIVQNSPNALPWLLLFVIVYIAWKWELVGGILVGAFGIATLFAFDTYEQLITLLTISAPLIIISILLIVCSSLSKRRS